MTRVLVELAVDSLDGVRTAVAGGADRIELCTALELGGLGIRVAARPELQVQHADAVPYGGDALPQILHSRLQGWD